MTIQVPASRMYAGLKIETQFETNGVNADWLRACINECTAPKNRLDETATDVCRLVVIGKFIGVPGLTHVVIPKCRMH